ncbi:MAG: ABC transporter [Anaerolineae bacterium]|nr:Vitamin B12 import ATP-binding protein BtuD [Anaerolineales bacterium]MCC6500274.1 ABC transporter ATP-binding protein [Anaerolineales bacterium]RIK31352.1 MAG: ABC transporter [Anaerolineae bacterium]WKZ43992.1 MAG: ABC transporter ATP-binding protein [Anaerolineales bacterium]WKZ46752.1 MAG: ABC transporter ATP-binding protein [Anaerolineales bacterium]
MSNYAIETQDLGRVYKIRGNKKERAIRKELVALEGVNLTVGRGELFGLLGPNGAGKTTLIKILTTLLAPTSGWARVAAHDVSQSPHLVRPRINMVSGGESSGYGLLTVRENLWMFSQFYGMNSKVANERIKELLKMVGLEDRIHTKSSDLSTGLRQKMNIVRGFLTDPEVLFLDEPTLGLDVGASRDVRKLIRGWLDANKSRTLLLTTHYMVEAEELCDRVAIINKGQVLACDTPANLKHKLQRDAIFEVETSPLNGWSPSTLEEQPEVRKAASRQIEGGSKLELILAEESALANVINVLTQKNIKVMRLTKREPTLEDVFMDLVGARMEDMEQGGEE